MAFQPFGFPFDVRTPLPPRAVKTSIRARKRGWMERGIGARGWIIGPIVCLWLSAYDKQGPMLVGRIASDNLGTRISGRAGSNLNGTALMLVWLPLFAVLILAGTSRGNLSGGAIPVLGAALVLGLFGFWSSHKWRKEAEPLVRFLNECVERPLRADASVTIAGAGYTLHADGGDWKGPISLSDLHDALAEVSTGDFLVLQAAREDYIQTAARENGFMLEMRTGDRTKHFRAIRQGGGGPLVGGHNTVFTFEEVLHAFQAYASDKPMPDCITWKAMRV